MTAVEITEEEFMKALTDQKGVFLANGVFVGDVIDLINRKNAEIDDLIKENIRLERELRKAIMPNGMTAVTLYEAEMRGAEMIAKHDAEIRAEAIKEFAERVKALMKEIEFLEDWDIDQIAKEMEREQGK